jgi:hypothetical protein
MSKEADSRAKKSEADQRVEKIQKEFNASSDKPAFIAGIYPNNYDKTHVHEAYHQFINSLSPEDKSGYVKIRADQLKTEFEKSPDKFEFLVNMRGFPRNMGSSLEKSVCDQFTDALPDEDKKAYIDLRVSQRTYDDTYVSKQDGVTKKWERDTEAEDKIKKSALKAYVDQYNEPSERSIDKEVFKTWLTLDKDDPIVKATYESIIAPAEQTKALKPEIINVIPSKIAVDIAQDTPTSKPTSPITQSTVNTNTTDKPVISNATPIKKPSVQSRIGANLRLVFGNTISNKLNLSSFLTNNTISPPPQTPPPKKATQSNKKGGGRGFF